MRLKLFLITLVAGMLLSASLLAADSVVVSQDDNRITLANGLVEVTWNKSNADLISIKKNGVSLLGAKGRGYLLGPGFSMWPATFSIVKQTPDMVELSFYHVGSNHFQYDLHYVLRSGISGPYCFLIQSHKKEDPLGDYGQTRWGLSADENLFDYHLVGDKHQGPMPKMASLTNQIQDWTFQFPDSTYYTKYDYAEYIEGRHVHGMAGQKSGYGIFIIQSSHEYLQGGPTKQYQTVHSTPYLICMFNDGHFLSDKRPDDSKITGDWVKLSGPFLLYINSGKDVNTVWADAKKQCLEEISKWPYKWMNNSEYPLERGLIKGVLKFADGKPAANAHVIIGAPGMDWQAQQRGYMWYTTANANGSFIIKNVRPGNYSLYSYCTNITDDLTMNNVSVTVDKETDLGDILWATKNYKKLWQIGIADRFTDGFKLSDHKRYYDVFTKVPAHLDYIVGKSKPDEDWYYAQTKPGSWNIIFDVKEEYKGEGVLTVGIAGATKNAQYDVLLNGAKLGKYYFGNDASIYRSAIKGGYYQKLEVKFAADLLKRGSNKITFEMPNVKPGGGVMYDVVKLEINDKPLDAQ